MSLIPRTAARTINRLASRWGFEIRRTEAASGTGDLLDRLSSAIPHVRTVVDVGAAFGDFSRISAARYPKANYLMVEPVEEYGPFLEAVSHEIPHARVVAAAASDRAGPLVLNVHRDLLGSSLFLENEETSVDGAPRTVPAVRIDDVVQEHGLEGPYILKADVQGAELKVLEGARELVAEAALILLEVSFFDFFKGGARVEELVGLMSERGFALQDIANLTYRPLDGALAQADFAFLPRSNPLRSVSGYASKEQRRQQDEAAVAHLSERQRLLRRGR